MLHHSTALHVDSILKKLDARAVQLHNSIYSSGIDYNVFCEDSKFKVKLLKLKKYFRLFLEM